MRWALLLVVACLGAPLAGCESCEFTYGSMAVTGSLAAAVPPVNLRVRTCDRPDPDATCDDGTLTPLTETVTHFDAWVPSEGGAFESCAFQKRYLVITADNCGTQVVDVLTDPPTPSVERDLILSCS